MDSELAAALARSAPGRKVIKVQIPRQFTPAVQEAHENVTQQTYGNTTSKNP